MSNTDKEIDLKCVSDNPPLHPINNDDCIYGIGLIDHFAGLAMQGFSSNTEWAKSISPDDWDDYIERMATGAYDVAKAMIRARKEVLKND